MELKSVYIESMSFKERYEFLEKLFGNDEEITDIIAKEEMDRVFSGDSIWLMNE